MKYIFGIIIVCSLSIGCSKDAADTTVISDPVGTGNDSTSIPVEDTISDTELLDFTQKETFKYFWDYAETNSGAARERYVPSNPTLDSHTVTTGGSGFGLMVLIVGIERGYITREEGFKRIQKILNFFKNADRFHGAWPHWIDGTTGKVKPFSEKDNGGDLVETSFFAQGLLTIKSYFKNGDEDEITLANQAQKLFDEIEWSWFTQGQNILYWHWSPGYGFDINLAIKGFNECLITYVLAASSTTYPIDKEVYTQGWASNGNIVSANTSYNIPLLVKHQGAETTSGPLFWSHYSFLGLNPNRLISAYTNYKEVVTNHTNINYAYCVDNPLGYKDYGENCWGLTASYSRANDGSLTYSAHQPSNDSGVISPTAALSSMPYTPEKSLRALHYFYKLKDKLVGSAGFYDAFSPQYNYWVAQAYLAIDQGPIVIMMENYRTQLLWNLFMQDSNVQNGLTKLQFSYE
ncbi:glucoamylase family protein [Zhouia sp. PK063]|uniref:glucoamylase family protein n=1 Tax=Zhouia sp. PK063 TaxID=3373602 RepID=UPI0037B42236